MSAIYVLGLNAYHGDASAVLLKDGQLIAAVEEERFRRIKHWAGFPSQAIRRCLEMGGIGGDAIRHVAVSRNPTANLGRKVLFTLLNRPNLHLLRSRFSNARAVRDLRGPLAATLEVSTAELPELHHVEHHPAHLASAFFVSPFEQAAVCALDGFGDFVSTSWALGLDTDLNVVRRIYFPHSLGLMYLALTQYLGFPKYGDEFKVMGLAPYGAPDYVAALRRLLHLDSGGGFRLDLSYFRHWRDGASMTWEHGEPVLSPVYTAKLEGLLGPARKLDEPLEPRHEAIAASLQVVFEEAVFHVLRALYERTRLPSLCLAGGCAMNSVANGKVREQTPFRDVYVQPAAADNGTALGAAYHLWHRVLGRPRDFVMEHSYWGPEFSDDDVLEALALAGSDIDQADCTVARIPDPDRLCAWTAERISQGKIVGWFQGRMEWGARALGNRSILADPRRADMRCIINSKIKFREKFRPFAPSVLEEAQDDYFIGAVPDPFMVQVYSVKPEKRAVIPAVTHVDGSGRIHTVSCSANPLYWRLLKEFERQTGVPVLLNTSFNENEPIVHTPGEALDCFLRTKMDVLVLQSHVLEKSDGGKDPLAG